MDSPRIRELGDHLRRRGSGPRRFPPNDWTIEETERRLLDELVEWAVVFDGGGRQLFRQRGTRQTVSFSADDVPLLRNAVDVHNHPRGEGERSEGLTLSLTDLVFAVRFDVAEMRVVTTGWRFTLRRPDGGWPTDEWVIGEVYNEMFASARTDLRGDLAEGQMTPEDVSGRIHDEALRRVAEWGRFDYRRETVDA
jgi:hypothetical protein